MKDLGETACQARQLARKSRVEARPKNLRYERCCSLVRQLGHDLRSEILAGLRGQRLITPDERAKEALQCPKSAGGPPTPCWLSYGGSEGVSPVTV